MNVASHLAMRQSETSEPTEHTEFRVFAPSRGIDAAFPTEDLACQYATDLRHQMAQLYGDHSVEANEIWVERQTTTRQQIGFMDIPLKDSPEKVNSFPFRGHNVSLRVSSYTNNGNLALQMLEDGAPYASMTTNISDLSPWQAAIDTNNLGEEIIDLLEEYDLATFVGYTHSGFCYYLIYDFDPLKLKTIDAQGVAEYCKANNLALPREGLSARLANSERASEAHTTASSFPARDSRTSR